MIGFPFKFNEAKQLELHIALNILSLSFFAVPDIPQSRQSIAVKHGHVESASIHLKLLLFPHNKTSIKPWFASASIEFIRILLDTSRKRSSMRFSMPLRLVKLLWATCKERSFRRLCKPSNELMTFAVKCIASKLTYGSKHFSSFIPLPVKCKVSFNSGACAYLFVRWKCLKEEEERVWSIKNTRSQKET